MYVGTRLLLLNIMTLDFDKRHLLLYEPLWVFSSLEKNEGACRTGIQIKKELKRNALGIALRLVFSLRVSKVNNMFWILIHILSELDEANLDMR